MKVLASISLAFLYLLSATDVSEIGKLPELYEHYQHHLEEEGQLSFLGFIEMHYLGEGHDDDHDHDLPFQDASNLIVINMPAITPTAYTHFEPREKITLSTSWPQVYDFLPSELSFDIWNPPRA